MGKGSAPKSTSTTSTPYLKGQVTEAAGYAKDLYNAGQPAYFSGSTIASPSANTLAAQQMIAQRAMAGSPLTTAAQNNLAATASGNYLTNNPYLDQIIAKNQADITQNFTNKILPQLNSNFAQSGRYGSGIQAQTVSDAVRQASEAVANSGAAMRYQNYDAERARQMQAAGMAPQMQQLGYMDANALAGVGASQDALAQARLQEQIDRYNYDAYGKQSALDEYITRLGALNSGGGTQVQKTAGGSGGLAGALAGGIGGLQMGSAIAGATGALSPVALGPLGGMVGGPVGIGLGLLGALAGGFG